MKHIKRCTVVLFATLFIFACEKYEDYIFDYIPTVYFGSQKPLRTLVARDDDMQFKFGVVLAGVRENPNEEWVRYEIDPDLLADTAVVGDNVFELMPEAYYSLSNDDTFIIHPGNILGEVVVTIDHDLFTADPDALTNTYAFPLRITDASVERILDGEGDLLKKDYTVIVVKYISQYSGYFYRRGVQYELDDSGNHVDTIAFTNVSLNKSDVWYLETLNAHKVGTQTTSDIASTSPRNFLDISIGDDYALSIDSAEEGVIITANNIEMDKDSKIFFLDYLLEREGTSYHLLDTLIQRQDPELDLRYEEW